MQVLYEPLLQHELGRLEADHLRLRRLWHTRLLRHLLRTLAAPPSRLCAACGLTQLVVCVPQFFAYLMDRYIICAHHTRHLLRLGATLISAACGQITTSRATSTHRTSKAGRKRRRSAVGTCGTSGRGTPRTDGRLGCGRDYCRRVRSFGSRGTSEGAPLLCCCCCCAAAVGYEYDAGRRVVEETQLLRPVPLGRMMTPGETRSYIVLASSRHMGQSRGSGVRTAAHGTPRCRLTAWISAMT